MKSNINHHHIKSLSFIKNLFKTAKNQSQSPEPICYKAILTLHDSIELYLELGCRIHGAEKTDKMSFREYFGELNKELQPEGLTQKASLWRLNNIRNSLKHEGIFPNKKEIEEQYFTCNLFFEENTPKIFGKPFDKISLIDFVINKEVKKHLEKAQKLKFKKREEAIIQISKAFYVLLRDFRNGMKSKFGHSHLSLNSENRLSNTEIRILSLEMDQNHDLSEIIYREFEKLYKYLNDLENFIEQIGIGIDLKKFSRFKLSTHEIYTDANGNLQVLYRPNRPLTPTTDEDIDFCKNFVIETSLQLSEFNFEVDDSHKSYLNRINKSE